MRPDFYEEYAQIERHHWWAIARRQILLTVLDRYVPHNTDQRVLDVGIGSGVMLQYLRGFGQVIGCDQEWEAFLNVERCSPLIQARAEQLPFQSKSIDLVTLLDLLEHTLDDKGVLCEASRVLRPGGFLCATAPAHRWLWGNQDLISHHVRRYPLGELERRIEEAGLRIVYRTYFNTFLFPLIVLIRVFRRWRRDTARPTPTDADHVPSDFSMTKPGRLNDALTWLFSQEARWIRHSSFPFGVSLLCLARKPLTSDK